MIHRLLILALVILCKSLPAQYTLDEVVLSGGGGYELLLSDGPSLAGPAFNAQAFYSHYFCGKPYGFQAHVGLAGALPRTADADAFLTLPDTGSTGMTLVGADLGFFFKLKPRDYHRPRETALVIGPRVLIPFLARHKSDAYGGSLVTATDNFSRFLPGLHASIQIRRPIGNKKSWFIEPGAWYSFIPVFTGNTAGNVSPLYLFLNFGFMIWDQRG